MNSADFAVLLEMRDILRKIVVNYDYYNESISAENEDVRLENGSNVRLEIQKLFNESGDKSKKTVQRVSIPAKLMNAAVLGISEEGSTRSAKMLAWSKLLNVKSTYSASDPLASIDLSDIDYIIISGGYDNSTNNRLNSMLAALGRNPQLDEFKPAVIFAGSRLSLENAKKELARPGLSFTVLANVLENSGYTAEEDLSGLNTLESQIAAKNDPDTKSEVSEEIKIRDLSYTRALRKISEVFCMKRGEKVLSALFTEGYSLLSHAEREARTTVFKNYAVPQEAGTLNQDVLESVFNDLFIEKRNVFDENFLQKTVLPIDTSKESFLFEPNRIIGISLTEKVDFEKFIDIISIPGMTKGTIYFLFDNLGIILASMTVFAAGTQGNNSFLRGFFNTNDIRNGWLFIPYGKFRKGAPAIYLEKLENDRKEDIVLKWGERRTIEIEPNSVVEIHAVGGVSLSKDGGDSTKKTIGTKESRKTLIFDLREEMNRWNG